MLLPVFGESSSLSPAFKLDLGFLAPKLKVQQPHFP
jgi:hypothetical protein